MGNKLFDLMKHKKAETQSLQGESVVIPERAYSPYAETGERRAEEIDVSTSTFMENAKKNSTVGL